MSDLRLDVVLAEETRIMDGWAAHYDTASLSSSFVYRLEREEFADWIVESLRASGLDPASTSLLDVGCGTGALIELLWERGMRELTGVDLSAEMIAVAERRDLPGVTWVQRPIEEQPFGAAEFDALTASFALHHMFDPGAFFRLADRVLGPDGRLFILEYDRSDQELDASGTRRSLGDGLRRLVAWKNRRSLAAMPKLERHFNPAHRFLPFDRLRAAMPSPEPFELTHQPRGLLRPTLLLELVGDSAFDRALARGLGAIDRRLAPRSGGLFQWVAGRRTATSAERRREAD